MTCPCPPPESSRSFAESLAALPDDARAAVIGDVDDDGMKALLWDWGFWARPKQKVPLCDWHIWLALAGRGFGKTKTGAEWIRGEACGPTPLSAGAARRFAIIGQTTGDVRGVMIEGETGLLAVHPPDFRPKYEPSKRKVTWPNGAVADLFNGTEPDQLPGFQFEKAWVDELAKFTYMQAVWDQLMMCLRLGLNPQGMVTTTPRPVPLIKKLVADPHTHVTRGSSYENRSNLPASWFEQIKRKYEGTRLGRQELYAEIIDDNPDALWNMAMIDGARVGPDDVPDLERVAVAVDPPTTTGENADECGITGGGRRGRDCYLLADRSKRGLSPSAWAQRAIRLYYEIDADVMIGEVNQGGDMVEAVIKKEDPSINFKKVRATRGKFRRAEPVAAIYEQGLVHHVGAYPELEDQMCDFTPDFDEKEMGYSPDRVDSLVYLWTELSNKSMGEGPRIRRL